jgi:hypothetical protein
MKAVSRLPLSICAQSAELQSAISPSFWIACVDHAAISSVSLLMDIFREQPIENSPYRKDDRLLNRLRSQCVIVADISFPLARGDIRSLQLSVSHDCLANRGSSD